MPRSGPRPGSTSAWTCPSAWRRATRPRPDSTDPAGTRTTWARTGPPLWLQRVLDPRLMAAVQDHRYSEWPLLSIGLGDIHPPHRHRHPGPGRAVRLHRHRHPGRAVESDDPVDSGRATASVALGHLPHADQRVAP